METKQFKAESKRLLEMMINSIYTHKEIFLRELISNASDAIDKLYFKSLTDDKVGMNKSDFAIWLEPDKDKKTLTISDNGIGMTAEDLENNLGTIAQSGSLAFKSENELGDDVNIIGQFGVGFYSAFMVAKKVTVISKAYGSDKAYKWISDGVDGYTIEETDETDKTGTKIILEIKDDNDDENYSQYLETFALENLVKKYSDYISFPIKMMVENTVPKAGTEDSENPEYEKVMEERTLNSMVPIWRKNKNELKDEDYDTFYREKFYDYTKPLLHIHSKSESVPAYSTLLYIPAKAPYDYYSKNFEKGLQLYSNGVMIMDKCGELLPDYFSFVKGIVDSEDLSLNISREMLQHDRQLKTIAKGIERNIKNELNKMLKNDRENYEKFFKAFGRQLKYGIYSDMFGEKKKLLQDLLLFYSSTEKKLTTLEEYVTRMKEEQKFIYYAVGETNERIESLPQIEAVKEKGYEILYLTEDVDEFCIKAMTDYNEKPFKSVSESDLGLETEEEKKQTEEKVKEQTEENKDLFTEMTDALNGEIKSVRISTKLKTHPVCISTDGQISLEMEKLINAMPNDQKIKAEKVLEINPSHPIFETLRKLHADGDKDKIAKYAKMLYGQALMIEGMPIADPVEFSNLICELMV
mgnify:CR=1 FL=1